ncbi:23S rRNA pseudouridine1911/1915/1917 synthase [Chitinophaga skermanii]|uniref:Pseudouridine synthase n=1 Tax=Chitinophaga skermanii TaxID=331697 RepID=A0A327QDL8_9BACT|nr:RluA family pseudouridine synthase [Chitinophaga skermanii]RAJ02570.1 23S rRNA pseudouridine1911/1915/1917 synthase [Chitinophaga skermanii]
MNDQLLELDDELDNGEGSEELFERVNMTVDKGQEPIRIDKFLMARIENATRNKIQQGIEAGLVLVNDKPAKSNYKIKPLDRIVVFSNKNPENHEVLAENIPLKVIYEDDDLMVIDKPAGMVVHPGCGNYTGTLVNGLAYYLAEDKENITDPVMPRMGLVHRIDKNTSGLLVIGKTDQALNHLANQFAEHTTQRRYIALVWGDFEEDEGTYTGHVGRHQRFRKIMDVYPDGDYGKEAITHYKVLERFNYVTLIECRLETGRTHQIRVHMQHNGHSLFNDDTYGGNRIVKGTIFAKYKQFIDNCFEIMPRHALHARTLGFVHPRTGEQMHFESPVPEDLATVVERWRRYIAGSKQIQVP